jgi:hypothetical protein
MDDRDDTTRATANLVRLFVDLVEGDEPRGLDLLRGLRSALAHIYAAVLRLPEADPTDSMAPWVCVPDADFEDLGRSALRGRIPPELYWSALLPMTWETVGDSGVIRLTNLLAEVYSHLKLTVLRFDRGARDDQLVDEWIAGLIIWGRPILQTLVILQEVVTDLESYERAWRRDTP